MEAFIKGCLNKKGYTVNDDAQSMIQECDNWYSNRVIADFHRRKTVQGIPYELNRMNFAKRCCSDDANLCEVLEINTGSEEQTEFINDTLNASEFNTQYRRQLEKTSAVGTTACYIRLDNATFFDNGMVKGGDIKLNYVEAEGFIPLTVENDVITEAAFTGSTLKRGKKETTLVLFLKENGLYSAETHLFDAHGTETDSTVVQLGNIKPFAVMRNAEVNNLDRMEGYGLPKLWSAIPVLKVLDLCFNSALSSLFV